MRFSIRFCTSSLSSLALLACLSRPAIAGNLEPPGPPSPTMKTIQQVEPRIAITVVPVTIAAPGSYYLTNDFFGTAGQVGITISSSFVTLDLNGFSLIGAPGTLDGIRANFAGTKQIVIRNGAIRGWSGTGVSMSIATDSTFEGLQLSGNGGGGLQVGPRSIVRNCVATGNTLSGIFADAGSVIVDSVASLNSQAGISTGQFVTVSNSTADGNGTTGINLNAGSTATDCTAQSNSTGFNLATGSRVESCVARQNSTGFLVADAGTVLNCTAAANTDDGIRVASRCLVRGNLTHANTNDGIEATGNENRVEENESASNGSGISLFGTSNLVIKNSVSSNASFGYLIFGGGNKVGTITTDPATAGPWANFEL